MNENEVMYVYIPDADEEEDADVVEVADGGFLLAHGPLTFRGQSHVCSSAEKYKPPVHDSCKASPKTQT